MMDENRSRLNSLSSAIGEFLSLRTDDFKKNIISGLSIGFSRTLAILVMVMILLIVLAVFAFAFIVLLGDAIGSWSGAAFIVGGVYLSALVVLFCVRKKLFLNMFTNLFTGIVESGSPNDKWKTLSLVLIRYLRSRLEE
jgi:hypothetical protein